ncbi:MAG: undecaprenyl/decaprenyl-phosphate alpha-N-acetylglucosaminyl 1-phosphate transferase [Acidobacteriaceae bacterium]|nr:undecaprenyl/decaprenyl-phosphate alpha-N-acetylglucosaminyl 1-phosphate transferase [Acidobacteriaceae bacterium]MBV8572705.1 undecaprenyl/decaprenyl-phosphate alpha-N-acetylglucosaminyl 1-phosphate transferase [Acidobacteriaceae bacterium]
MFLSVVLGAVALLLSVLFTPLVRELFLWLGVTDIPDNSRKLHRARIPRVGGIAVFLSYLLAFLISHRIADAHRLLYEALPNWRWLLGAVLIVFITGLIDDVIGLQPKAKLMGQVTAAGVAWAGGVQISIFQNIPLHGVVSLVVTVGWLVICANSFNLIDGLDGLATGAGLFAAVTMFIAAVLDGNGSLILLTGALIGSLIGFLRYNFNPASIFLGDCGSLTLGFLLGCFGALWSEKTNAFLGLMAPIMAMALPLLDTSLAIVRRLLRNRPIFAGDRSHVHHRLLDRGKSQKQTALLLYGICGIAAIFSLLQQTVQGQLQALIIPAFCICIWLGVRYLGYLEFGFAGWFLAKGTLFRLIDDQIRLRALEKALGESTCSEDVLQLVEKACCELGFTGVFIAPRAPNRQLIPLHSLSTSHVSVPLNDEFVLVLEGVLQDTRPIALSQLISVVTGHFRNWAWSHAAPLEASPLAAHGPFSVPSEVAVVSHLQTSSAGVSGTLSTTSGY